MSEEVSDAGALEVTRRMHSVVTHISSRRRGHTVETITFVFGGVHYGTFPVTAPYTSGRPLRLYVVPRTDVAGDGFAGPIDCLVTDEPALDGDIGAPRFGDAGGL